MLEDGLTRVAGYVKAAITLQWAVCCERGFLADKPVVMK